MDDMDIEDMEDMKDMEDMEDMEDIEDIEEMDIEEMPILSKYISAKAFPNPYAIPQPSRLTPNPQRTGRLCQNVSV